MSLWRRDPIDEELADHLERLKQERLAVGDSENEAIAFARRRLGNLALVQDEVRDLRLRDRLDSVARHIRFALRSFGHHGGAYLLATGILALGIGLSVAMFSLVQAVVLAPLPFPEQDRIHLIWKHDKQVKHVEVGELAYPELADLQTGLKEVEAVALMPAALYGNGRVLQAASGEPVQIETCPATPDFFRVLGVKPALGRDFQASDEGKGAAPVVMLSDAVWREHFGARREAIGEVVRLNSIGHTVIGVMAPAVNFPRGAGLWVPLSTTTQRSTIWLQAVARVRPGVSRERLTGVVDHLFVEQYRQYPQEYSRTQGGMVTPLAEFLLGSSRTQLLLSLAASLFLLISASVSAGNLFLSRALARRREVATRTSLGASRAQILLQFGVEAMVAAAIAAVVGSLIAFAALRLVIRWAPADIPRIEAAALDRAALAFAGVVGLLASVACMAGPALLLREKNYAGLLREGGLRSAGTRTGRRLQSLFVAAQAALTVAILAAGLLLFLSYRAMQQTDIGFAHRDALTMNLALRGPKIDPPTRRRFYKELLDRLRSAPEVTHAAAVLLRPMEGPVGWDTEYSFEYEAGTRDPHLLTKANFEVITPGYFATMGTPLLEGRDFAEQDADAAEKVAVISRSLAQRMRAAGHPPIGERIRTFGGWHKIVGVVADARYRRVVQALDDVYVPYGQVNAPTNYLVLRGSVPAAELLALVRRTLKELDPRQAIAGEATLGQMLERHTARDRFNLLIMMLFAAGAVVLAAAGIHSVIAESVTMRAKEIAVKSALGAGRGRLVAEAICHALVFVLAGEVVGVVGALLLGRSAADLLYGVSASDPLVLGGVALMVFGVAALSSWMPAWIAAGRDPRASLQLE